MAICNSFLYVYQRLHALSWIYEDFGPTANELEGEKSGALRSDGVASGTPKRWRSKKRITRDSGFRGGNEATKKPKQVAPKSGVATRNSRN